MSSRKHKPRVEYTISLTWTVAEARRWWKKNGTLNDASFKEFEEKLENEAVFGEFVQDLHVTGFEEDLRLRSLHVLVHQHELGQGCYFEWVAGRL